MQERYTQDDATPNVYTLYVHTLGVSYLTLTRGYMCVMTHVQVIIVQEQQTQGDPPPKKPPGVEAEHRESVLQCVASVLQCVASVLQCVAVCCSVLRLSIVSVLQCVAVCSSVLPVCCSVLQCVAVC